MQFDFDKYGSAFLAVKLHKLRTLISAQCEDIFAEHDIAVPSSCVSIVLVLKQKKTASISQIAASTTYSHQLVSQHLAKLEALNLVKRTTDKRDNRRLMISLTDAGIPEAEKLDAVLHKLSQIFDALFTELDCDLQRYLISATMMLQTKPLSDRAADLD